MFAALCPEKGEVNVHLLIQFIQLNWQAFLCQLVKISGQRSPKRAPGLRVDLSSIPCEINSG